MGDYMLRRFSVQNFKNFRDRTTIDFTDSKRYEFNESLIKDGVISKAIIYGKNGSGKTNLGLAIFDIESVLLDKGITKQLLFPFGDQGEYVNAYKLKQEVEFEYEFQFNDDIVTYMYQKKDRHHLLYEELIVNDEVLIKYNFNTKQRVINIPEVATLNFEYKNDDLSVVRYIANNSSLDDTHPIRQLMNFVKRMLWFSSFQNLGPLGDVKRERHFSEFILRENKLKDFESFLKSYGLNFSLDFMNSNNEQVLALKFGENKINYFNNISSGTRDLSWFYYWKERFEGVSLLFIDEFDVYYHYELSKKIVSFLKEFNNMQVILTTHNTFLLNNELLRPDCYFTIDDKGIKNLPQRTEKEIRQAHNLEKMYRNGEFD